MPMTRALRRALAEPHPFASSVSAPLLYGLGTGLFIFLFFSLFQPLGFSLLPALPRRFLFAGYGLVTALAIAANGLLLPRLLPRLFREERWNLGRQLLWMAWVTLTVALGAYAWSGAVCARFGLADGWVQPRTIVLDTFLIALLPITVISLANASRLQRRNATVVSEANRRLELALPSPPALEQVEIVAENGKDRLRLPLDELLAVQSEENYVRVHVAAGGAAPALLRSSLDRVARQLRPRHPLLFRCHRAWIVNLSRIARVEGNAQGLKLSLSGGSIVVPVARRYIGDFRRALAGR